MTNLSSENFRKWAASSLSKNLIVTYLIYHTSATRFGGNWNPSGINAENDPLPHILSCHSLQSIVTGWQIVRGPQPDSCLREWGSGEVVKSIRFLSPQQSIIIVYISTQNSPVNLAQQQGGNILKWCRYVEILDLDLMSPWAEDGFKPIIW